MASEASALEQQYAAPLRYLHWLIAAGTIGAFGFVQAAQRSKGADKANYMMLHKSLGLSVLVLTAPRLALRLATKIPAPVPGSAPEQFLAAVHEFDAYPRSGAPKLFVSEYSSPRCGPVIAFGTWGPQQSHSAKFDR